jgi:hypothetical protein
MIKSNTKGGETMRLNHPTILSGAAFLAAALLSSAMLEADQPKALPAANQSAADLVKQLDADEFASREEASRKLTEMGAAAVPELAAAAQAPVMEASTRAFDILKRFATGSDAALQGAAREALAKLAAQRDAAVKDKNDSLAAAATRASEILKSPVQGYAPATPGMVPNDWAARPALPMRPGVPAIARAPRMIIHGMNIGGQRVSVKVVNGTKEIDAEETQPDGQKRNVKIVSDPQSGIRMEVTTTKDGKPQTEKYAAKDAETLKKEHPEAHKLYEQYGGGGPGIQIGNGGQIRIQGGLHLGGAHGALPAPIQIQMNPEIDIERLLLPMIEGQPLIADPAAHKAAIEEIRRQLKEANQQIGKAVEAAPLPAAPPVPAAPNGDPFGE